MRRALIYRGPSNCINLSKSLRMVSHVVTVDIIVISIDATLSKVWRCVAANAFTGNDSLPKLLEQKREQLANQPGLSLSNIFTLKYSILGRMLILSNLKFLCLMINPLIDTITVTWIIALIINERCHFPKITLKYC